MLTRPLEPAGRTMEPVYGFQSLLAVKAHSSRGTGPLWLVCPGPAELPHIARAVSAAYLPHVSPGQAIRLVRAPIQSHRRARKNVRSSCRRPWRAGERLRHHRRRGWADVHPAIERAVRAARPKISGRPEGFRFPDLRHYLASLLIGSVPDVKVVQHRLRHGGVETTLDPYGHLWPDSDESARAAVGSVLAARAERRLRTERTSETSISRAPVPRARP